MKTNDTPPNSSSRQASLCQRLGLACLFIVAGRARARGATFFPVLLTAALWGAQSKAASIPVYTTNDSLAGSLRQAIQAANPQGGDTIVFQIPTSNTGYNAATGVFTITLTEAELGISGNLTIDGGGQRIAVQRSTAAGTPAFRIFNVTAGNVVLSGLTISNGDSTGISEGGGGIRNFGGNLTVLNCTISNNNSGNEGGGIFNVQGALTVNGGAFRANTALYGGGIYNRMTATVSRSTFSGNTAGDLGGGIYNFGLALTLTSCTITGNHAAGGGGGVDNANATGFSITTHVRNTIIAGNSITGGGGRDVRGNFSSDGYNFLGVMDDYATGFSNAGSHDQAGTTASPAHPCLGPLQDNGGPTQTSAPLNGSFVIDQGHSSGLTTDQRGFPRLIDDPAIFNAGDGTDIGACEVEVEVHRVDVTNNNDSGPGSLRAAIANDCVHGVITFAPNVTGTINLTSGELLIDKNLTINGPGANLLTVQRSAAAGTPNFRIFKIEYSVISAISGLTIANGNTKNGVAHGGGILNNGTLTITNSVISGNTTNAGGAGHGGGIFNGGTLTLTNSVISGNTASTSSGGGILNSSGTLTIINSTISGNSAAGGFGGGIWNYSGILTITNSTISGNSASNFGFGGGGGIFNDGGAADITNSTISGNTAEFLGGGIGKSGAVSTLRVRNTIIALNTSASSPDVYGPLTSQGFNLIGNSADAIITPAQLSDRIGVTAAQLALGPLRDNGGPTHAHALLSGSLAIDKGHSSGSSTDQRGFGRRVDNPAIPNASGGDGGDIGAFEFGAAAVSLQILSITRIGNSPVMLQVAGFPYGVHRIQASVDLSFGSFIDIATVTADAAGRFQYQDPVTGLTNFYRVAFP